MTTFDTNFSQSRAQRPARRLPLMRALDAYRSRRALAALTPERLEDLGLTAQQAQKEAARPIWDVPANWCE